MGEEVQRQGVQHDAQRGARAAATEFKDRNFHTLATPAFSRSSSSMRASCRSRSLRARVALRVGMAHLTALGTR